jgi:hypothetical protein
MARGRLVLSSATSSPFTILYKYVLGRAWQHCSWGGVLAWLGQLCIHLFYLVDRSKRIEFAMLWPEVDGYWTRQQQAESPSFRHVY